MNSKKQKPRSAATGRGFKRASSKPTKAKNSRPKSTSKTALKAMSKKLAVVYLAARGMVGQYLKKLKVKYLTPDETAMLATYTARVPSLQIIYDDINSRVVKGYWYVRYLEAVYDRQGKEIRFIGAPKLGPFFYFARTWPNRHQRRSWKHIAKHIEIDIFFTEGPFKANALARIGCAAIGLAGVYAFLKDGKLLPEFSQIQWGGRIVFIVFDNDIVDKPNVRAALGRLIHELTNLGALPKIINLPDFEATGVKVGIDDYLVEKKFSTNALDELEVEDCEETTLLHFINSRVGYVRKLKAFWDTEISDFYRKDELITAFAPLTYTVGKKTLSAAVEWIKWPQRCEYDDITYAPGAPSVVDNKINTWPGWGVEAIKGNVRPVLALIDYLLADCPEQKPWFLQWLAYPIQHPGAKLFTSVLFWSSEQGVGKSMLAEIVGDIYGPNRAEISRDILSGDFNAYAENTQFVHGDEITGSDSRHFADKIKGMITREQVEINKKFAPQYFLKDCTNYFFTSNHVDAFFLEDQDRRLFVVEVSQPKKSNKFYADLRRWRDKPSPDNPNGQRRGVAAFRWYLENEVDLTGFTPYVDAPITDAKKDMQDLSLSDLNRFTRLLRDDPDSVLQFQGLINPGELFELNTLIAFSNRDLKVNKGIESALSKALRNAGFRKRRVRVGERHPHLWA
ncbi:MAG: DUF3854 domain-containing protein, partial [Proteobacteria bacterium]|nr:DUF3854 domain-containing protein [Pseudomonadota bacterium]